PGPNEYQTTAESVRNAFRNIDVILRRTPAIPRSTIEKEFTDIKNAVTRLRDIAEWENTQSQVYYQQIGNLTNQLTQLQEIKLYNAIKSKAEIKKFSEKLQLCYENIRNAEFSPDLLDNGINEDELIRK
ncbi:3538_t:CDS:2, partial [Entrophospora sp. SA101]